MLYDGGAYRCGVYGGGLTPMSPGTAYTLLWKAKACDGTVLEVAEEYVDNEDRFDFEECLESVSRGFA